MRKDAEKRHQEVLDMIEKLSEVSVSERASMVHNLIVFHRIHTHCFTDKRALFLVLQQVQYPPS
jgi:hypothetical protein